MVGIKDERGWIRHIFNDLTPYICIFPTCNTPGKIYSGRRDWFNHLEHNHSEILKAEAGPTFRCPLCHESNLQGKDAEKHLGRHLEDLALFALPRSDPEASNAENSGRSGDDMQEVGTSHLEERQPPEDAVMDDVRLLLLMGHYLYICVRITNIPILFIC